MLGADNGKYRGKPPNLEFKGELRLSVRLHVLTSDVNPWGLSSAGVLFSSLSELAPGVGRVVSVRARARALSHSASRLSQEREREAARASGMKRSPSPLSFSFPPRCSASSRSSPSRTTPSPSGSRESAFRRG